jgi:predicted nucleic acid-binding protein
VVKVVDASALGAILFAEPAAETVVDSLRGERLAAPILLGYEITNVCLRKIRANPAQRVGLLAAFAAWSEMGIELAVTDHAAVLLLAEQSGLTSYDASYLWLAQKLNADLVTLDRRLANAADRAAPG